MSAEVTCTWAGRPSRIATRDGPWDSPAVSQRSMPQVFHAWSGGQGRPSGTEIDDRRASVAQLPGEPRPERDRCEGGDQHERTERKPLTVHDPEQTEQCAAEAAEEKRAVDAGGELGPAEVAERHPEDPGQPHVAVAEAARV